jgi:hypothetical protein
VKSWVCSIVVGLGLTQASPDLPPASRVSVAERLWLVQIVGWSTDPLREVYAELVKVCGDPGQQWGPRASAYFACQARNTKPVRNRVATLHAAPSETSPVVASIYVETKIGTDGQLAVTNVDRASHPGERLPWPDAAEIGGYGLHVAGAQRRGNWVRLFTSIPADGWLRTYSDAEPVPPLAVRAHVEPLTEIIVGMSPLLAVWPDGRSRLIDHGSFLIQKIDGAFIEFRAEIPSDFACGEAVTDPVPVPPTLRAAATEFFNPDGSARFAEKYTKGC